MKAPFAALFAVHLLASNAAAATFTVTTTSDAGAGSLRAAIVQANGTPAADRIVFNIAGGPHSIHLLSALPAITAPVAIDATTQPGYFSAPAVAGKPWIEVEGTGAGPNTPGFVFGEAADGSSLRGFAINRFDSSGVLLRFADRCTVAANHIGTDLAGKAALPNNGDGVTVYGFDHVIGGVDARGRNVLSSNGGSGVGIGSEATGGFRIIGNYIGTDSDGIFTAGNGQDGVYSQAPGTIGGATAALGNLMSGNARNGITLETESSQGCEVHSNLIGTNVYGTSPMPNGQHGIEILGGTLHTIGSIASPNTMSGNALSGIRIGDPSNASVVGNYIGTTLDGTRPLGNGGEGISIIATDAVSITGNVICANQSFGIYVNTLAPGGLLAVIQGNFIGTNRSGAAQLGNASPAIWMDNGVALIGGVSNERNVIAYNTGGITVRHGNNVVIRQNSIYENGQPGIDLFEFNGGPITPNDALDADTGPNDYQNFPTISSVTRGAGNWRFQGSLASLPNRQFRIELFSNRACDENYGHGQGESFVGDVIVNTNGAGAATFDVTFNDPVPIVGLVFTATATTTPPGDVYGNTSEFSPCYTLAPAPVGTEPAQPRFALGASIPTPARGTVHVPFSLGVAARVDVRVYDVAGRRVATLLQGEVPAGRHAATWEKGRSPGTYWLRFEATANDGSQERFVAGSRIVVLD